MRSRWDPFRVRRMTPLEALVYRSRLLGAEETLGLYGGGNTSLKCTQLDPLGHAEEVLWVKGSGAHLKDCEARHFSPLSLAPLRQLTQRHAMTDDEMVRVLERYLLDPKAPRPSIETLLHAFLPEVAIDHTHADAILSVANTRDGERLVRRVLGPTVLWIPYLQPGFLLSRRIFEAYQRAPTAHGAILQKHGLITWGPDGRTSYLRTIASVSRTERFLAHMSRRRHWSVAGCTALPAPARLQVIRRWLPTIRRTISQRGRRCLVFTDSPTVLEFVNARRMPAVVRRGPATPDHMLRTKRVPLVVHAGKGLPLTLSPAMVVRQLQRYAADHERYFQSYHRPGQTMQDPYPRIILIPGVGMLTSGQDATEAAIVADVYQHAMSIMRQASTVGIYVSVTKREAFAVEYWPLELYKLSLAPPEPELSRMIGLITGAAGGIGRAIAERLVERGASLVVTDVNRRGVEELAEQLNQQVGRRRVVGHVMDVTRDQSIQRVLDLAMRTFGGMDFLVSNAGVAYVASIDRMPLAEWERSLAVNATGHFLVSRRVIQWLRVQGMGGALVFIASKNVLAPGKDFGAYSAAKAAETQLARVLAIENGERNIRVNIVNPDGVFEGSGLWEAIKGSRAKTYGVAPNQLETFYQRRNLLKTRVLPQDVAEAVGFFVSPRSAKTTGCILTVDGGLREAFPR